VRVIAGQARGVPLVAPRGGTTRPTADLLKGAIFSVLGDRGCQGRVLDLYAGSGSLGIEALSRGADWADFVESAQSACKTIRDNLAKTRLGGSAAVHCRPVEGFLAGWSGAEPYDLVLLDPPYAMGDLDTLLEALAASPCVGERTTIVVEHASRRPAPVAVGTFRATRSRVHGDGAFTLLERDAGGHDAGGRNGPS
jgi:16S rRNA (guanine966-N2)-methyltransferase